MSKTSWFDGFDAAMFDANGTRLHARVGGRPDGAPVLLLHGFPQTHVLWHRVARELAPRFRLVLPDLRGYGDSAKPEGGDHAAYSKRTMAADLVALMNQFGHARFHLVGHDRGARVAHRLALDHPQAVSRLCLIDIAPTLDMYEATDMGFATAYHHWFHLIQPAPFPERMIVPVADFYLHSVLGAWGPKGLGYIEAQALAEYERSWRDPATVHAACEDYRASAGIDLEHDRASRAAGERIACPLHVMWGEHGVVHRFFDPPALWRAQCSAEVTAECVPAGHFIPEECPERVTLALQRFLPDRV